MSRKITIIIPKKFMKVLGMKYTKSAYLPFMITFGVNLPEDEFVKTEIIERRIEYISTIDRAKKLIEEKTLGKPINTYHLDLGLRITQKNINTNEISFKNTTCDYTKVEKEEYTKILRTAYIEDAVTKAVPKINNKKAFAYGYTLLCYLEKDTELKFLNSYIEAIEFFRKLHTYYAYKRIMRYEPNDQKLKEMVNDMKKLLPQNEPQSKKEEIRKELEDLYIEL
ncbi:hypothetical protein SFV1gp56 [Sulfolobus filamentous virus 1]|uniref:Uncharacterized protein n=2 Tax=Alphalipothrixvirus beppuense TaxID=2734584 RepID=A0A346LU95_SUFV1|nr:hypothetical protein HOT91_gp56 [Sulfolobus filamentous virus 1]AXQ00138.1 hypothetical protein SFV1gp56 [Sulfolobus filamentous virus 1]AZI75758.1 hypothetical protein SBFV1_gp57 [Sulfolobales Beppu filamentous phage 1]